MIAVHIKLGFDDDSELHYLKVMKQNVTEHLCVMC